MRWFPCRKNWTTRMLLYVNNVIDAPIEMTPPGMLTPDIYKLIVTCPRMIRAERIRKYMIGRMNRG